MIPDNLNRLLSNNENSTGLVDVYSFFLCVLDKYLLKFLFCSTTYPMKPLIHFVHGKESGPWGSKIQYLAQRVKTMDFDVDSLDYSGTFDPQERVEILEQSCKIRPATYLVGSSMGGWVALTAGTKIPVNGVFLLAPAVYMEDYPPIPEQLDGSKMEIVHGWHDSLIPYQNAIRLANEVQCTLHLINDEHRLTNSLELLGDFLTSFLKRRENIRKGNNVK